MGEEQKRTGRKRVPEERRSKIVNVRFTENEVILLNKIETRLGLSRTDFIRKRTLSNVDVMIVSSRELATALDAIGIELKRSGNNINQLARHANTLNLKGELDQSVIEAFNPLFEIYLSQQRSLETLIRAIMRASGNPL